MEQHQLVHRPKHPDKSKKAAGGAAAAGAAHACTYFKVKATCKRGDASGCSAGAHGDSKPFETKAIGQDARERFGGGGKGKGSSRGKGGQRGGKGGKSGKKGGKGAGKKSFTEKAPFDKCKDGGLCYCDANGQKCGNLSRGKCSYIHNLPVNASTTGGAAAPVQDAKVTTPKSTNAAQAMALFQDFKARGMTQSETMDSLNSSDFFAGCPQVVLTEAMVPPHRHTKAEEVHHDDPRRPQSCQERRIRQGIPFECRRRRAPVEVLEEGKGRWALNHQGLHFGRSH
jgi:hypothetical protein